MERNPSWCLPSCTIYVSPLIYKVDDPYSAGPDADLQNGCECIHSFTRYSIKDSLKDITNYGRNLEIILECRRLEISVGNVNEESCIFKKLICSVITSLLKYTMCQALC